MFRYIYLEHYTYTYADCIVIAFHPYYIIMNKKTKQKTWLFQTNTNAQAAECYLS